MSEYEVISLSYMKWSNIISAAGFLLTILSIAAAYLDYRHRKNKESAEKAIDMAKYFMDEILPGLSLINKVCSDANLSNILNKYKFYKYEDFDENELTTLFSQKEIETITGKFKDLTIPIKTATNEDTSMKITTFATILLNKLEYMCMFISSHVADDEYIYKSLHQMFLSSIQTLYINIAKLNIDEKDKYYTNIIEVFNIWKNRHLYDLEREKKINQKLEKKIKKIKKQFKKSKKIN